ncbi:MAG: SDR family NAD(P)-dependent oxidoreductase [Acidobacteria bacterium]|nr:SDR family NAD(P)-dependent oxidoreductase [Acidobacteriota bacterium]
MTESSQDELLERARKVIRDLREKLSAAEARNQPEPIAVTGLGLRFPGCGDDPQRFWQMIEEGRDAVVKIPRDRWDREAYYAPDAPTPAKINTRHASFLEDVRRFDAAFFDITPTEAVGMDPQQRIFLETAWHAFEDAGLTKQHLTGSDTGVFVGVHSQSIDYLAMQQAEPQRLDAYSGTGTAHDVIAGRLAYWLDLHGPAVVVNTACSSSLVAVHLACRSLRAGDCTVAVAGGVNLLLTPMSTVTASQLQLLSPDGRCKTFDSRADGMGRGEGCGVVVLKKLSDARRDGDRVHAVLRGSAVNQDGRTNGLTAPNGLAQQRVLRRAVEDAGVDAGAIGYVEAHGTGTPLGDPIEIEALGEVFGRAKKRTSALTLGAVKANVGHLEGAAGIAGLIKAVMVLKHRWLPPVANLERFNTHLVLEGSGIEIPKQGRVWEASAPRIAGVSSFGWSGTNAHVVLEEAVETAAADGGRMAERPVLISAQSAEALKVLAAAYAELLDAADAAMFARVSYTSAVRRTHHAFRLAVAGGDGRSAARDLRRRIAEGVGSAQVAGGGAASLGESLRSWESGAEVAWERLVPLAGIADLPLYPFQGREYWLDTKAVSAEEEAADRPPDDWFYKTEWIERPLSDAANGLSAVVLIHSPSSDMARVMDVFERRGIRVLDVLCGGGACERLAGNRFVTGEDAGQGLARVFEVLAKEGIAGYEALYFSEEESAERLMEDALAVSMAFVRQESPSRLWFVTRGADGPDGLGRCGRTRMQSAVRGFSRVFGLEYPERSGGLIDVDWSEEAGVAALCDELETSSGEDRVALWDGRRWVARLRRDRPALLKSRLSLRQDCAYLVTGAFGELGVEIASWLVERGARHLVLLGRRRVEEVGNARLLRRMEEWRKRGVAVVAEACDVAVESQVQQVLDGIAGTGRRLAGAIHAAARLVVRPISEFGRDDVHEVFHAKVEGARVLDRLTRSLDLDFFVVFSSAATTIGLRNGALYAAANGCLDEIVRERREGKQAGLCIEWGSWEYAREETQRALIGQSGFEEMQPARAMRALESLLQEGRGDGLIAAIDWKALGPALEMRTSQALVEDLLVERDAAEESVAAPGAALSAEGLTGISKEERSDRVCDFVAAEVRRIFGMVPEEFLDESRGLFQMGMDSLMSVRLKRALEAGTGLRLPGTLTLLYPNVSAIAAYLEEKLVPLASTKDVTDTSAAQEKSAGSEDVSGMDDEETSAAIAAEIAALQQKLGVR